MAFRGAMRGIGYRSRGAARPEGPLLPPSPIGVAGRAGGLVVLMAAWLEDLRVRSFSRCTLLGTARGLRSLLAWAGERGLHEVGQITAAVMTSYQRWLYHQYRDRSGLPLAPASQKAILRAIIRFFRWCVRHGHLSGNPAADLEMPRSVQHLPRLILSQEDIAAILAQPDLDTLKGLRDRAILEVLYSTGMRRAELCDLHCYDIHWSQSLLLIRDGKGRKDRYVPVGASALAWLRRYLDEVRPKLVVQPDEGFLFLNLGGGPFGVGGLGVEVRKIFTAAGIPADKRGSCHLLRHAVATHLLDAGCNLRVIQDLLGHSNLETTATYTHLSIAELQRCHARFHPLEQQAREAAAAEEGASESTSQAP